ncbi:glycosyltransferase family 2 protein [Pollutibacter soli]|uniref:glycosyltransferase family 2 protein n=1 Tax=Pollutibacter soli TaxID=3034157 RepID=UPI003013D519
MKPLAFIIITYNRPEDLLALVKNICQLNEAASLLEEIIIINNSSQVSYSEAESFIKQNTTFPFKYIYSEENLGVARGRNFAITQSTAPILIMLDDDAEMGNKDCLINLLEEIEKPTLGRSSAIISFKVLYYSTHEMQVNALPHKNFSKYNNLHSFPTYYYAGGAHAIKREALNNIGMYPEDFFYGMEEYDLSYRLLDAGYGIRYSDRIIMLHKESPLGRQPKKEKLAMMWVNKSKVAWRHLPLIYFYSTAFMWSLEYLRKSGWDFSGFIGTWNKIFRIPATEKRNPVCASTRKYLRAVEARLWY